MQRVHILLLSCLFVSPAFGDSPAPLSARVYHLAAGPDLEYRIQDLLVQAVPGDVIEFGEGTFPLTRQIDIATDNITLRGQGSERTILSFKGQTSGGQGIEATGNNFVIEHLAIEDTAGNAIKVIGSRNVTFRHVRAEWTGEPKSSNGAYGLYPVQCTNVLIDSCIARGASDSGIYVGQSRQVVVRGCLAERNVAGIEIENTVNADVYDNVATNNSGGLLVFDLPGLQLKAGRHVRLFNNKIMSNNHRNFAAAGNIVALVPPGTGVMIMATDQVEVFDNQIRDNDTSSVSVISYLISGKKLTDAEYDPYCKTVSIRNNVISGGGRQPNGALGRTLTAALGTPLPDILFDGTFNPQKLVNGQLPQGSGLSVVDNGNATFVNFKLMEMTDEAIQQRTYSPSRDVSPYTSPHPALEAVTLSPHDPPKSSDDPAVLVYRTAPKWLSEYGLLKRDGELHEPAEGVIPYDLNTTLFSDHAAKYRLIKLPSGQPIRYADTGVLEFPEGTVISKTFAYPHDRTDPTKGERLVETRIETRRGGQWYGYSYLWNDEQTDASLLLGGGATDVAWIHDDGKPILLRYEIPNANQCLNCHSQEKAYVPIGPTARNLNRDYDFAEGRENQLAFMAAKRWLEGLPALEDVAQLPDSSDIHSGTLDQRARAWLDVNCAHCHSPAGTARMSGLDLRFDQFDPSKYGLWKSPVAAGHGSGGREYDVVPGDPDASILVFRMESDDPSIRMPSVGRSLVPDEAVELIREWITQLPQTGK